MGSWTQVTVFSWKGKVLCGSLVLSGGGLQNRKALNSRGLLEGPAGGV